MFEPNEAGFLTRAWHFLRERAFYLMLFLVVAVIAVAAWLCSMAAEKKAEAGAGLSLSDVPEDAEYLPDDAFSWMPSSIAPQQSAVDAEPVAPEIVEPDTSEDGSDASAAAAEVMATAFAWPLSGDVAAGYSVDALQYDRTMADWRTHAGMDIEGSLGAKVSAAADGTVERIYEDPMYGVTMILYHGAGLRSVYSNLAETPTVAAGDAVSLGQVIGAVGDTADAENGDVCHLHFAMTLDECRVNPMDYLPTR